MATNSTTKKPAADAAAAESAEAVTETAPARPSHKPAPEVVGPALAVGAEPIAVTLAHHHTIDGTGYPPGAKILVSPDYAHRLRAQGYATQA
ncbi:hypothetical protein [Streptomyces sp. NPDC059455]|uniref:DUF7210 family protein n=1 Tax=Streptomyces sp. NPDC059455 TaxID=3346837 RepID=UPI00369DAF04